MFLAMLMPWDGGTRTRRCSIDLLRKNVVGTHVSPKVGPPGAPPLQGFFVACGSFPTYNPW